MPLQRSDPGMVAVEQREEAGLGTGRAFGAAGLECRESMFDFRQIQDQIVGPQTGPLADRRRLGGLQMGESQAGQIAMRGCETAPDDR